MGAPFRWARQPPMNPQDPQSPVGEMEAPRCLFLIIHIYLLHLGTNGTFIIFWTKALKLLDEVKQAVYKLYTKVI